MFLSLRGFDDKSVFSILFGVSTLQVIEGFLALKGAMWSVSDTM